MDLITQAGLVNVQWSHQLQQFMGRIYDAQFLMYWHQVAFVPNAKGTLHKPSQLYDPRATELLALLNPDPSFPAPSFCDEDASGASVLPALQQLGLRSSAGLDTLLQAAKYVAALADRGGEGDEDEAVGRGQVCVCGGSCLKL